MSDYSYSDFSINELGSFYEKERTVFRVFAPDFDELYLVCNSERYRMEKKHHTFEITLVGDHERQRYHYERADGISFRDPFSYMCDHDDSYVLDKDKFIKEAIKPKECEGLFIYEMNVRDFSISPSFPGKSHGKFDALVESGLKLHDYFVCGLDYLKNTGINCIQLMPVFDYDLDHSSYNWGYNPLSYNSVYSGYISDSEDCYAYVNELRRTVNELHRNDIRVNLDVVFNHVYDFRSFDMDKMIPGHVFRYKEDGSVAEGTFCGNEIRSEDPFMSAYIVEMCRRYIEIFDIDGLRLDLMGIMDIDTVKAIRDEARKMKKDFMVYGEGWNMGDVLDEDRRATIKNAASLESVMMFNDQYREIISDYVAGNNVDIAKVKEAISASSYLDESQSLNYIECHDGYTFFDRLIVFKSFYPIGVNLKRCRLGLALTMISRGMPFVQMGQEFYRTKKLADNSYNLDDSYNEIDWNRRVEYNLSCDYFKALVKIRKDNKELWDKYAKIEFHEFERCLIYDIGSLRIYINPSDDDYLCESEEENHIIFNGEGECDFTTKTIAIEACSLVIGRRVCYN